GETVLRTAYLPHRADITSRTADHLIAAADAMRRLRRRFSRPGTRPDVIVATAPAIPTLMVGRALSLLWDVPLVVEMRDAWPDLVTHVGPVGALGPEALLAARRSAGRRLLTWTVALVKGRAPGGDQLAERGARRGHHHRALRRGAARARCGPGARGAQRHRPVAGAAPA